MPATKPVDREKFDRMHARAQRAEGEANRYRKKGVSFEIHHDNVLRGRDHFIECAEREVADAESELRLEKECREDADLLAKNHLVYYQLAKRDFLTRMAFVFYAGLTVGVTLFGLLMLGLDFLLKHRH